MNIFLRLSCLCLLLLLGSCVTRVSDTTPVLREAENFPEEALLDIAILPFESRYARTREPADGLSAYRWMEGFYVAHTTADTLGHTAGFGSIRMDLQVRPGSDLIIRGRIVESDPRRFSLSIRVEDATGRHWYTRQYLQEQSYSDYQAAEAAGSEPFQNLYNQIANDLLAYRQRLTASRIRDIRLTSAMLFAREFSPEAFSEYLHQKPDGSMTVRRLPSENDPVFRKMVPVKQDHEFFLQAQQAQLDQFYDTVATPYFELRKSFMDIRGYLTANLDTLIQTSPEMAGKSSSGTVRRQIYTYQLALARYQNAREFSINLQPLVIEMGKQVITLQGSAEDQYQEWKAILKQLYLQDRGLEDSQLAVQDEPVVSAP